MPPSVQCRVPFTPKYSVNGGTYRFSLARFRSRAPAFCGEPVGRSSLLQATLYVFLCFAGELALAADPPPPAVSADESPQVERRKFRLVSINIPPDSDHRKNEAINKPPKLYVVIKKNGVPFDWHSSSVTGWTVSFPANQDINWWPIWVGTKDRYDIEIWDEQWGADDLVLTIGQLPGESLRGNVVEVGDELTAQNRLVKVVFEDQGDYTENE